MDNKVDLIKGISDYYHLDMKTHNKYPAPAAEIPWVVIKDYVDEVFL